MILTVANQKGGVGKTTTAINLASAFATKGLRTLLIDLDPQGNSTMSFLSPAEVKRSVYDVLVDGEVPFEEIIQPSERQPGLEIAPSSISLAKIETKLIGELDSHFRLADRLEAVSKRYEYIVVDTPPTLGIITVNALVASSHILIPIQASYFALEGTDDLLETIDKIKLRANPQLQILGVLLTLFDKRTLLCRDIQKQVAKVFGEKLFKTVISRSVRLEESPAYREAIFTYAPRSSGAYQYYRLSEEILSRV